MPTYTSEQVAQAVNGVLEGPGDIEITGVEQLDRATPTDVTFVRDMQFAQRWSNSNARVALIAQDLDLPPREGCAVIRVPEADIAMAVMLEQFAPPAVHPPRGIDPRATVDPTAVIDPSVAIGPGCVVGANVQIAADCVLHANVVVLDDCRIGPGTCLYPGAVVRERCTLGARVTIQANAVIGTDGFGYRPSPDGRSVIKIPQIGTVEIHDDVEIGACTCVDRAKFSATVIGAGTKIDNHCQIAHNCRIGRCVIIAADTGIGGSVTIGDGVMIGGCCAIRDQVTLGPGSKLAGNSGLTGDLPAGESYFGYPARPARAALKEQAALRKLPDLLKIVRRGRSRPDKD